MYQLLTDSCCDLPYQTLHDHQVEFVSMHFTVNGTDYEDDLEKTITISMHFTSN